MSRYIKTYPTAQEFADAARTLGTAVLTREFHDGARLRNCAWVAVGYGLSRVDGDGTGFGVGAAAPLDEGDDAQLSDAEAAAELLAAADAVAGEGGFAGPKIRWGKIVIWAAKIAAQLLL